MFAVVQRVVVLVAFLAAAAGTLVEVKPYQERCVGLLVGANVLAAGSFSINTDSEEETKDVTTKVRSPSTVAYDAGTANTGQFAFTPDAEEVYELCFNNAGSSPHMVSFDFNKGIGANDFAELVELTELGKLEAEFEQLKLKTDDIYREMQYQREREAIMRDTNENTRDRVMYLSLLSVLVLLALALWQVCHLRRFFKDIKLLR